MIRFSGICTGRCEYCLLKTTREKDSNTKAALIQAGDVDIIVEQETINMFEGNINWCINQYCRFDGVNRIMLVDVKNKSDMCYREYKHDLGLIVNANELTSMIEFRNVLGFKYGFILYRFKDCVMATESRLAIRHSEVGVANSGKDIYWVDFDYWYPVNSYEDLERNMPKSQLYDCSICHQSSYRKLHRKCEIKHLNRKMANLKEKINNPEEIIEDRNDTEQFLEEMDQ